MITGTPTVISTPRPLFAPGVARRMWLRFWPLVAFYVVATPAGFIRAFGDDIGLAPRAHFSLVERLLLWDAPTVWLQQWLLDERPVRLAAAGVYVTWFLFPLTVAVPLLLTRPHDYWRLIGFLLVVYYAAMPFFALYPLEPPWMHHAGVQNLITVVFPQTVGKDPNPYAAMPSLHVAMPAAAAFWYGWRHPFGKACWAYASLISITVVYTGGHYFADAVAGCALSFAVYVAATRLGLPFFPARLADTSPATRAGVPVRLEIEPERVDEVA